MLGDTEGPEQLVKWSRHSPPPSRRLATSDQRIGERNVRLTIAETASACGATHRTGGKMADVFVSYSRTDSPFVARLASAVDSGGKKVWLDTSDIEDTEVCAAQGSACQQAGGQKPLAKRPSSTEDSYLWNAEFELDSRCS